MALEHGVMLSKTSPAFLHANSTSHTWCFSAIAEIIDNAYDPDVSATELQIDQVMMKDVPCLTFTDNGAGMTAEKLHLMLSFGYCDKAEVRGHKPVGQYGNGFKSGSMRLGKDAIVLTKCKATWSVGFLSQTFLEAIKADTVLVPIITFDKSNNRLVQRDDTAGSLNSIFKHSIFTTMNAIMKEYKNLDGHTTGTRIIIYNLKRGTNNEMLELDFNSNPKDIINSEHHEFDPVAAVRLVKEYTPEYRRSLREYCSILFLKPRMKIFIRGEKVRTKLISKSLRKTEVALYRPRFMVKPVKIIFGFSSNNEDFGLMMYHRNRLIKAYERVGCQRNQNGQGVGVVGIVEVDFLEPIHNKQDFSKTDRYNACMNILAQKLNEYCQEKSNATDFSQAQSGSNETWTWAQCDNPGCLKWRRLPLGVNSEDLPDKWFCYMNMDPTHNRCEIEEEPEDEDKLIEQGRNYEKHLKKQKSQKENTAHKQVETVQQNGFTRVELEHAKLELEQAKRREEEQKKIIEDLKRQKHQMELQQKRLGEAIMNDVSSVASISNIVQNGQQGTTDAQTFQRKRKSIDIGQKSLKKQRTLSSVDAHLNPENKIIQDDDETQDVKPQLVVKFPARSKKRGDVIVIDDSDSDAAAAVDGEDDADRATNHLPETSENNHPKIKEEQSKNGKHSASGNGSVDRHPNDDLLNRSRRSTRNVRSVRTQTMIPDNPNTANEQLNSLRSNVVKLLQVILPNLDAFANIALENVDNALIEVLRVNGMTGSDDRVTTSVDQVTRSESTSE